MIVRQRYRKPRRGRQRALRKPGRGARCRVPRASAGSRWAAADWCSWICSLTVVTRRSSCRDSSHAERRRPRVPAAAIRPAAATTGVTTLCPPTPQRVHRPRGQIPARPSRSPVRSCTCTLSTSGRLRQRIAILEDLRQHLAPARQPRPGQIATMPPRRTPSAMRPQRRVAHRGTPALSITTLLAMRRDRAEFRHAQPGARCGTTESPASRAPPAAAPPRADRPAPHRDAVISICSQQICWRCPNGIQHCAIDARG